MLTLTEALLHVLTTMATATTRPTAAMESLQRPFEISIIELIMLRERQLCWNRLYSRLSMKDPTVQQQHIRKNNNYLLYKLICLNFERTCACKNHNEDGTSCLITRKRLLRFLNEEVVPEGNLKKSANRIAQYMRIEVMGSI